LLSSYRIINSWMLHWFWTNSNLPLLHRFIIQDSNLLFYDQRSSLTPPETKPTGWVCCHQGQINCCLSRAAISFDLSVTLIFTSLTKLLLYGWIVSTHYYKLSAKLLIYSHAYMASFQKIYIELVLSLFFFVFLRFKIISCYWIKLIKLTFLISLLLLLPWLICLIAIKVPFMLDEIWQLTCQSIHRY